MDKIVQVQRVAVNCCSAKEAMQKVVEYIQSEPIHLAEMVTMETLMRIMEEETQLLHLQEFDFTFAGNKEVLASAGVTEERLLREAEDMIFLKMFLRYLHKNHHRVFMLSEDADSEELLSTYLQDTYPGIQIVGCANMQEHGVSDDMILNKVNGTETDCILAFLESPLQEQFIVKYRSLLNARLWMGLGLGAKEKLTGTTFRSKVQEFLTGLFVKKKMKRVTKDMPQI